MQWSNSVLKKTSFILSRPEKNKIIVLFVATLFLAVMEMFSIGIIIPIMNLFVDASKIQSSHFLSWLYKFVGARDNTHFLTILITAAFAVFIFKSFYTVFVLYKQRSVAKGINLRLSTSFLNFYLARPYAFNLDSNTAILFRNISDIVNQFATMYLFSLIVLSAELVVFAAIACLLISIYPFPALLFIAFLSAAIFIIDIVIRKKIKRYADDRMQASDRIYKFGLEALNAVKEIKVYNAQTFFSSKYKKAVNKITGTQVKFFVISGMPRYLLELMLWASVLTVLLVNLHLNKDLKELVPMMAAFALAALRILPAVNKIYIYSNNIKYHTNTVNLVYQIAKEERASEDLEIKRDTDTTAFKKAQPIVLRDMVFRYKKSTFTLFNGINLEVPSHTTIAFFGATGSGKSTLVDILMGLLWPQAGELRYGTTVITPSNVLTYRKKIGYVPQAIFLIDDTLEANIAFGVPAENIDHKQLEQVIEMAQLGDMLKDLPEGTRTKVGEKGLKLSGGQRQRIAIARALYRNPEILIMDEATSALDGKTEAMLNSAIRELYGKLTIIIVAHRLSTIKNADTIYVMDRGTIIEKGTFSELREKSATFKRVANQAMLEEGGFKDAAKTRF